jgi:adenylate kinase
MAAAEAPKEDFGRAADYAEKHDLYALFERLLQELIVQKPDNPIDFLIKTLQSPAVPRVVISGAPASGKGTQCELIVKRFGLVHISTGDVLREHVKQGTPLGKQAQGAMSRGELVPDELIINMVKEKLATEECRTKGWLLDGFPRTQPQAQAMLAAGIIPDKFVLLDVPDDVLIDRVIGRRLDPETNAIYHVKYSPPPAEVAARCIQREDDTEEKARVRLAFYHRNLGAIRSSFGYCEHVIDGNRAKVGRVLALLARCACF